MASGWVNLMGKMSFAFAKNFARGLILIFAAALVSACTSSSLLDPTPYKPPTARYAAIVVSANSGKVLHDTRADARRFPASLTKMMTLYMLFDAIDKGKISKSGQIPISARAAAQPASKLWLKAGTSISVNNAIQALAVKSANDVAYAVAERLGGSESRFAALMTAKARSIGMRSTTFKNASGLPNRHQVTTARDMAKLGISLKKRFPHHFHYFGRSSMKFRGKNIRGHNKVLKQLRGANGIKTGYTRASGFNLVTSVSRNGKTVVGVILGENSGRSRDQHMVKLMRAYMPKAGIR